MAATGSTEPASTHIPGRDTNTRFADFADTTSPHVEKQSDTLASDRYRTAEATGMAGTGLHNTNADVTTTDRSLGNTGNTGTYSADKYKQNASGQPGYSAGTTGTYSADKYKQNASGQPGYSAGTTHQKYNEPTSKYDTSTVTGKIKDKLDPNSRDLNTSGSYNDPTSKHDTSTLTGKIMDKLDPETGGVEPSGYAVDNSKQPLAGSVGDEPSGYGLKSSNKPSDVPYSTTAEPSGYGLDPSNADPKFSTATSAEPSGYGLEESKKHHLGTTTAAGVGAGVGAGAYAASHDSSRSHEYNDPTSKYDTSTVTGKIKDKLDPHSRDLNTSGNYNDPTSKYGTSTTTGKYDTSTIDTGNMTEKVNPYSRNLNTGNYNDPTSKYDTSTTTTGKVTEKVNPYSRDLDTSGNYNNPTSKYDTSTTTGKMKDKLDPHSRDLNTSGNYGTSLGTTAGAGATHISTGTSGLGASNPAGNDSHLTKDTSSRSAFDNRQYGCDNEYSDTIPGSYPEKIYSSGTSTHVTDSPHLGKTSNTGFGGILDESIDYEDNKAPYDASYYGSGFTGHADTTRPDTKYDASREVGSGFTSGHVAGNSASKHDSHYNNPASKYDTSRYTGRVADKVDPTSRNRGATYDSQDTKHLNDPNSKYDTSKLTGRVADKLDPSSRKTEMTGSEDYSSSPDKAGSYDFREGKRFGEISPTLKYSDRSDKIQPSRLDSNHPTGAGLNASNTDSSTLPTTRGEEFLSEKEKKIVQEHFSNVNQNLKPGMPEVAGVAVFPLTHEQVQHATPRSQNAVTSEEGTDATTDKQKTSKKDYSLRT